MRNIFSDFLIFSTEIAVFLFIFYQFISLSPILSFKATEHQYTYFLKHFFRKQLDVPFSKKLSNDLLKGYRMGYFQCL